MNERGASIRIFLPTGDPEGTRIVSRSHWTGSAVVCSRSQFSLERELRQEFARPGVYLLVGPSTSPSFESRVYVGEGDVLGDRINQQDRDRDFWTRVIAFSSADGALNKALIKYVESRLVKLAQDAQRAEVENGNVPPRPALSEADRADAEAFLHDMLVIYPLMGVTAFEAPIETDADPYEQDLFIETATAKARGREVGEEFVLFKGSQLAPAQGSLIGSLAALRDSLATEGKIVVTEDGSLTLLQDRTFQSPSYAASFVTGRATNGRTEWKNADGVSLKAMAIANAS